MWSEAKLGHLLLLDPFRMLETWHAWTLIMIKWLGLALWRLEPWLWSFGICLKWLGAYTWKARTFIMIFWYLLEMAWPYTSCMHLVSFWPLKLIIRIHLWWAQVLGLEWFKKQFSVSIPSRVQSQAFGLEFIYSIQGSNNYDRLKHWTWAHHGSNNGQTHA